MNAIESPIFEAFRQREKQIKEAIKLLRDNNYVVYKEVDYAKSK